MSDSTPKNRKLTTEEFIERAKKVHGSKYSYEKSVYKTMKSKLIITCHKHGDFSQIVGVHLIGGGCPRCKKKYKLNTDLFKSRAIDKHGELYDYSKSIYLGYENKITITCKKHGDFDQISREHLNGRKCPKCRKHVIDNETFIKKSKSIHGDRYDYLHDSFISENHNVKVVCKKHGIFEQKMDNHFRRDGCKKCKTERKMISAALACREDKTSYKRSGYVKICQDNNGMSNLYVVEMSKDSELFYKVGITKRSILQRFRANPYKIKEIRFITGDAGFIFDLESQIHRIISKHQYTPKIKFEGSTLECFSAMPKEIIKLIDNIDKSNQLQLLA